MATGKTRAAQIAPETEEMINVSAETENGQETANTTPTEGEEKEQFIYIGPSVPGGLMESSIFIGTLSEVKGIVKDISGIEQTARLVVPVSKLAEKRAQAKEPGNILHKYYTDVTSLARKRKKGGN